MSSHRPPGRRVWQHVRTIAALASVVLGHEKKASAKFSLDIFSRCSILGVKEADRVIADSICLNSTAHGSALVAAALVLVRLHSGAGVISD